MPSKADKFRTMAPSTKIASKDEIVRGTKIELDTLLISNEANYENIDINLIRFNPANEEYRAFDSEKSIRDLSEDLKRNGLIHNIAVSERADGSYMLLSGERRTRAYRLLYDETRDPKWLKIFAQVRTGLDTTEEELILDAANLQTRGGAGGEMRVRKSMVRFIDNIKHKFGLSDDEAQTLMQSVSNLSNATVSRNLTIATNLIPELTALYDKGLFGKPVATTYATMPKDEQIQIYESLADMLQKTDSQSDRRDFEELNKTLMDVTKEKEALERRIKQQELFSQKAESEAETAADDIRLLMAALDNGVGNPDVLKEKVAVCEQIKTDRQKEVAAYSLAIRQAKVQLQENHVKNVLKRSRKSEGTEDAALVSISKIAAKLERAADAMGANQMLLLVGAMPADKKGELFNRLNAVAERLRTICAKIS